MIKQIYPTSFYEEDDVLSIDTLNVLYSYVLATGDHARVLVRDSMPELMELSATIKTRAEELAQLYGFSGVQMSDRLAMHFFPPGAPLDMQIHADDFGDVGRKFVALLYLEAEPGAGGELVFYDPRWFNGPWQGLAHTHTVTPATNKLVIFPSFLWHKVNTYHSQHLPRMAIDTVITVL